MVVQVQSHGVVMPRVVVCIPAFNEERTIARVVLESQKYSDLVIVCDDGSTDLTGEIARKLGAIVVRHERNRGYGAALRSLFKKALEYSPEIVVTLDADLQHDPRHIPLLIEVLKKSDADIAIASRIKGDETPLYRRIAVKILSRMTSKRLSDVQSGFRAYKASILQDLIPIEDGMEASIEIINKALKHGYRIIETPVPFRYRGLETSTLNPIAHGYNLMGRLLRDKILKRPLTYLGVPGVILMIIGLSSGLWVIKRYIEIRQLATGTAIITAILLLSGLLLVLMSIHLFALKEFIKLSKEE